MSQPIFKNTTNISIQNQSFLEDIVHGLSQVQKSIACKWFYDEAGSALFEKITQTPEYYPTRVEAQLLNTVAQDLPYLIPNLSAIIEPGSGASIKTRILLDALKYLKTYVPMDISAAFLKTIAEQLAIDYPLLQIKPMVGDFTQQFSAPALPSNSESLIFFPGSTIGNFSPAAASELLKRFHDLTETKGWLLIGVDSTQNKAQLLAAYNDAEGITAAFNKNLLVRANTDLNANFDLNAFVHEAIFNASTGRVEMHLRSLKAQSVTMNNNRFDFKKDETIFTESCYKYTHENFLTLASASGWQMVECWQDDTISAFTIFLLQASE